VTFTVDDLFRDDPDPFGGNPYRQVLDEQLVESLRAGSAPAIDPLESAVALVELLQSEYMAFGTDGTERLNNVEIGLVQRAAKAVLSRLGTPLQLRWRDFASFKSFWLANSGYGSWAARRAMVAEAITPVLQDLYQRQDAPPTTSLAPPALDALTDASAIHEHLRRLSGTVDADPRLAVSVAKDLVESTAKLVLRQRAVPYTGKEDLPALVARAQESLGLHAAGVAAVSEEARALRLILGSLATLTQGVTELRNKVGVGHGRESVPTWVKPRHARLASGAAATWCNLMLETLGDPEAPWRA
jgi:hypothetical protein